MDNWIDIDPKRAFDAHAWAGRCCPSLITVDAIPQYSQGMEYRYRFYFSDPRDQTAFALRWA